MNELSLFTGAGGGILASILLGWNTIGYVEYDEYCKQIIRQRIRDGIYDDAPVFGDIREFDGRRFAGCVDVITSGFPCQPFSVAGKRAGADDERNMWPETLRIIGEVRPRYAFLENVLGLISSVYFGTILCDLAALGYDAEWCVLGADDIGAPHRRKRLWILAHTLGNGSRPRGAECEGQQGRLTPIGSSDVADTTGMRGTEIERGEPDGILQDDVANSSSERLEGRGDRSARIETEGVRLLPTRSDKRNRVTWWDTDPADVDDSEVSERGAVRQDDTGRRTPEAGRSGGGEAEVADTTPTGQLREAQPQDDGTDNAGRGRCDANHQDKNEREAGPTQPRLGLLANELADRPDIPRPDVTRYIPRVATGVRDRVNRLKAIGNGQVPLTAVAAWHMLINNIDRK